MQPSLLLQLSVSLKQAAMGLPCADAFYPLVVVVWLEGCVSSAGAHSGTSSWERSCWTFRFGGQPHTASNHGLHVAPCIIIRVWLDMVLSGAHVWELQHLVSHPPRSAHGHVPWGNHFIGQTWSDLHRGFTGVS